MKVLHVENSSGRGGSLKSLVALWPAPEEWDVEVVSLVRRWSPEIECPEKVSYFPKQSFFKAWRYLQEGQYDIVHINNAPIESWSFILAAYWEGVPVISHLRSVRSLRKMEYVLTRMCQKIIILSHTHAKKLPKNLNIEIVPNGIDDPGCGDKVNTFRIGMFAVLKNGKGQEDVIEALSRIDKPWELWIVGGEVTDQESSLKKLQEKVKEKNLENKVIFKGHVEDAIALMKQCLIVVDASHKEEGFRRTISEAAMTGRAVYATDVGGAADLLEPEELLKPGDINAWEQVLEKAFSNLEKLRTRGQELREKSLKLFDRPHCRKKFWTSCCESLNIK